MKHQRAAAAAAAVFATALMVTACSSTSSTSAVTASGAAAPGKVITLDYWAWGNGWDQDIAVWNKEHPDIQVRHTDAGGGNDSSAKLLAAVRAGNAPDLALIENTSLPRMIVAGVPLDITDYVKDIKGAYADGTWAQTTFDGHTYAYPQDVGPMALVYRSDIFQKYGLDAPVTWDDFRKDAEVLKAQDPTATLATLTTDGWGWYAAVAAQVGDMWWSLSGDTWTVNINGDGSKKVMNFFQGMYDDKLITTEPILTPEYNAKLNDGTMLSWPSAVWAPGVLYGVAPDTAGDWSLAPLPRWNANDATVSYQGGSSVAVVSTSKHPKEAAEFGAWLNASPEGSQLILNVQNSYPAAIAGQEAAKKQDPPKLMPQQTDYYDIVAKIASDTRPVTWGPDTDVAQSAFTDAMNAAVQNGTSWADALDATQKAVVADMKEKGFKVSN
ncbi:ABC transporter substrate-binding protein [Demequina lutea]|uniref:Multiple sugar transport system substrate-binding protein n=1 Tax=Demequina lutea TaxID=431489 RepID=A0A7Y9ZBQ0_9MICO|nr:sugar ABC transporter substrate-binding protein [Demequina lutea]NYI42432.1 multiple sugar transport system substrate-binding protein [Demequina lutea]